MGIAGRAVNLTRKTRMGVIIYPMDETQLPPPQWIAKPEDLARLAADLQQYPQIAVDTESNSLYAYQERVCLIQFSTPQQDYLLDPLALRDLSILRPFFANPDIEKIFHAAEYDLICLKRDFDIVIHSLFDTMQAARILGKAAFGLGAVLESEFGITLDKRYQRANWGLRPLPAPMLNYARLDSHYLIALRARQAADLQAAGRWELAREDFVRLSSVAPLSENGHDPCLKMSGSHDLTPQQLSVLKELCAYRDAQARRADRPPFKVLGNDMLIEIAQTCPASHIDLIHLRNLPAKLRDRHGGDLLAAVRRGLKAPPTSRVHTPRPNDDYLLRLDRLREWRKKAAREMGVESDIILPRETLEAAAEVNPATRPELDALLAALPWRQAHYADQIWKVLHKG